jgi:hypothetical protein
LLTVAGILMFGLTHADRVKYERRMTMIEHGEVKPQTLYVLEVSHREPTQNQREQWWVTLGTSGSNSKKIYRSYDPDSPPRMSAAVMVYRFDDGGDGYFVPEFEIHVASQEWYFLAVGLGAIPVAAAVLLFKRRPRKPLSTDRLPT